MYGGSEGGERCREIGSKESSGKSVGVFVDLPFAFFPDELEVR